MPTIYEREADEIDKHLTKKKMTKQKKDTGVSLNRIGEAVSLIGMVVGLNLLLNASIKSKGSGVMIFILSFVLYLYGEKK